MRRHRRSPAALVGEKSEPEGSVCVDHMHCSVQSGSRAETGDGSNYFLGLFRGSSPPRRPAPFRSCSCSSPIRLDRVLSIAWRARGQCHRIYPLRDHLPHLRHHAISAPDTLVMSYSRLRAPFSAAQDRCRAGDSDVPESAQYTFIQGPDGIRRRANKSEVSDAPEGARIFRSDLN